MKGTYKVRSTVECSLLCLSELETCASYSYQHLTQQCDISDEETIDSVDVSQSAQVYEGESSARYNNRSCAWNFCCFILTSALGSATPNLRW